MAWELDFLESFELYGDNLTRWHAPQLGEISTSSRTGSQCMRVYPYAIVDKPSYRHIGVAAKSICVGFGFKCSDNTYQGGETDHRVLTLRDGSGPQFTLVYDSSYRICLYQGDYDGTKLEQGTTTFTPGSYIYIEFEATIDGTSGSYSLKIDGVEEYSDTDIDTDDSAGYVTEVHFRGSVGSDSISHYIDDVYFRVSTALETPGTGFIGPLKVLASLPSADATNGDFSRSGGTSDYENVDETLEDGDTSYLYSSTTGHKVSLDMSSISLSAGEGVVGVQASLASRSEDSGFREVKPLLISGATEASPDSRPMTEYAYRGQSYATDKDPNTSEDWTISAVNSLEVGAVIA
jgi:hypothetical protein